MDEQNKEIDSKPHMVENFDREKKKDLRNNPYGEKQLLDPLMIPDFKEAVAMATDRIDDRNEYV